MEKRDHLTTENIRKKFTNQFELVNYAIKLAENMILTGRESRVKMETQNRSLHILEEIATGKDQFDEVPVREVVVERTFVEFNHEGKGSSKKARKAFAE